MRLDIWIRSLLFLEDINFYKGLSRGDFIMREKVIFGFPVTFKKRSLAGNERDMVSAIIEADGNEVLVSDVHHSSSEDEYVFGKIRFDPNDAECYYVQVPLLEGFGSKSYFSRFSERRFHYHEFHSVELVSE